MRIACDTDLWVSVDEEPPLGINRAVHQACSTEHACTAAVVSVL